MPEDNLTEEEARNMLRQFAEEKETIPSFFSKVVTAKDTTKTGNLSQEELGYPKLPVRTYKELELFSRDIASDSSWGDYFQKMSEIQTATSLSKDAILLKLVVTTKKELADVSPVRKENKGWFKKKNRVGSEQTSGEQTV